MRSKPDQNYKVPAIPGSYYGRIEEARLLTDQHLWDEAAAIYERIINRIARLPERRRKPGSALDLFLTAATADLHYLRTEQKDYAAARELCRQLQTLDAENGDYWQQRVHVLSMLKGDVDAGIAGLRGLAESEPEESYSHWIALAQQSLRFRRPDEAGHALEQAEALAEKNGDPKMQALVHFTFFRLLRDQKRWNDAAEAWQNASRLDEDFRNTVELVVRMFLEANLDDNAKEYLNDEALSEPITNYYRGLLAHRRGDKVRARHIWRQLAEIDVLTIPEALTAWATAHCWLGQPLKALGPLLQEVKRERNISLREAVVLGLAWAMQGNLKAAHSNLSIALQIADQYQPGDLISSLDWQHFDELVEDGDVKGELRKYFE